MMNYILKENEIIVELLNHLMHLSWGVITYEEFSPDVRKHR